MNKNLISFNEIQFRFYTLNIPFFFFYVNNIIELNFICQKALF